MRQETIEIKQEKTKHDEIYHRNWDLMDTEKADGHGSWKMLNTQDDDILTSSLLPLGLSQ